MRYVWLVAVLFAAATARAQDGAAAYRAHCATCHSSAAVHVPPKSALRTMSLSRILAVLQNGVMKTVGDTLTPQERYAVALYLSATTPKAKPMPASAFCNAGAPSFRFSASDANWTGWSTDASNARFQNAAAAGMRVADVPRLKLRWAFALGDETNARSQPAVEGE
ncbi:MAG: cytochrome c [Candidatus Acidiferrales bacterium]